MVFSSVNVLLTLKKWIGERWEYEWGSVVYLKKGYVIWDLKEIVVFCIIATYNVNDCIVGSCKLY